MVDLKSKFFYVNLIFHLEFNGKILKNIDIKLSTKYLASIIFQSLIIKYKILRHF